MKMNVIRDTVIWRILQGMLYVFLLACALFVDIVFFYTTGGVPALCSISLYACALTYASASLWFAALFFITCLPAVFAVAWPFFMIPVLSITVLGFAARSLVFVIWPVPYFLVGCYVGIYALVAACIPAAHLDLPRLTIFSFFVILIVIKIFSLILTTHRRQGNRV